jgi:hypothetical protein
VCASYVTSRYAPVCQQSQISQSYEVLALNAEVLALNAIIRSAVEKGREGRYSELTCVYCAQSFAAHPCICVVAVGSFSYVTLRLTFSPHETSAVSPMALRSFSNISYPNSVFPPCEAYDVTFEGRLSSSGLQASDCPSLCAQNNDGHDTGAAYADTWLQGFLEPKLSNANFITRTAVVVIFDENSGTTPNQVKPQNPELPNLIWPGLGMFGRDANGLCHKSTN